MVVVGVGGVGKSSLVIQLTQNKFVEEYDPTIEDFYNKQVSIDGESCLLDIWDTAGREEFYYARGLHTLKSKYQGYLLVYAITSRRTLEELTAHREHILKAKDSEFVPMVLCGNKCDLENHREVPHSDGEEVAKSWNIPFFETSALSRVNVEEAFFEAARGVRKATIQNPVSHTAAK
uniref:Uncharacterized protein n=1 Tax=Arcella intermedia TaxID=1963864 RepID=A0A6B2LKJ2_9EUKA